MGLVFWLGYGRACNTRRLSYNRIPNFCRNASFFRPLLFAVHPSSNPIVLAYVCKNVQAHSYTVAPNAAIRRFIRSQ